MKTIAVSLTWIACSIQILSLAQQPNLTKTLEPKSRSQSYRRLTCKYPPCLENRIAVKSIITSEATNDFDSDRIQASPLYSTFLKDTDYFFLLKIHFMYRFLIRQQKCSFKEWNSSMPGFWEAYMRGTSTYNEMEYFSNRFWNISVRFDPDEDETLVQGNCEHTLRPDHCIVQKAEQTKREINLCFSGGLLECLESSGTCVCLNSYGTSTVRVNPITAAPSANGVACFVQEKSRCMVRHFGLPELKLPCVNKLHCNRNTGKCERTAK